MVATLDLCGVFVFALSGASLAFRKDLDIVGVLALGLATALAGGAIRDVTLGDFPITAFESPSYIVVSILAVGVALVFPQYQRLMRRPVIIFDSVGLALFSVVGSLKAAEAGLGVGPIIVLGSISAVGGGVVRDVLVRNIPSIFAPNSQLYVIPAAWGSAAVAIIHRFDAVSSISLAGIASIVWLFRLAAIFMDWRSPSLRRKR